MATHKPINTLEIKSKYTDIFLLKTHAVRTSQKGSDYLDITVMDVTGEITGKMWKIDNVNCDVIVDSDFIILMYEVEEYNGNKQLRINNFRSVTDKDVFNMAELVPASPIPPQVLYDNIYNTALSFKNEELKKVVTTIYDERKEELLKMPAAKSMHHAVVGGLLLHMSEMLDIGKGIVGAIKATYPSLNEELLYAGIALHDICKLDEFQTGPIGIVNDYTALGKLQGHLHMGAAYVENKCDELKISAEVKMLLSHMILSHHGEPEYGSAVRPCFQEASLLNYVDNIDAKLYMFNDVTKNIESGTFSQKVFGLDGIQVYKHNLNTEDKTNDTVDFEEDLIPDADEESMF